MNCAICNSKEFALNDGVYYCCECLTQVKESRHEVTDQEVFSKRSLLRSSSSEREKKPEKEALYSSWTSTEAYNLILFEQVSALIKLGASKNLKDIVFYIWSHYLQKCEVAFRKDYQANENVPNFSILPRSRDIRVFYGNTHVTKKRKVSKGKGKKKKIVSKKGVENLEIDKEDTKTETDDVHDPVTDNDISDATSTSGNESTKEVKPLRFSTFAKRLRRKVGTKKNYTISKKCTHHMTLSKTLCFCYLGLLYADNFLLLTDLLRLVEEGSVPYIHVIEIFPETMKLQFEDTAIFNSFAIPDVKDISVMCAKIIDFLKLPKFKHRSLMPIILRYSRELNLPYRIIPVTQNLINLVGINKSEFCEVHKTSKKIFSLPMYEAQAMAFILVALKLIYILDDEYENQHSDVMLDVNNLLKEEKLFVWSEWRKQLSLKEFLFTRPDKFELPLMDSLSFERIISKYPHFSRIRLDNEHDKHNYRCRRSRKGIQTILEGITKININAYNFKKTSFPLTYQLNYLMENWRTFPFYSETSEIDFSFINKDFSKHLLFCDSITGLDLENEKLVRLSLAPLYEQENTEEKMSIDCRKTLSKYWCKIFPRRTYTTDSFVDQLPASFSWLLKLMSKLTRCYCRELYPEVLKIEKKLLKSLKVKKNPA